MTRPRHRARRPAVSPVVAMHDLDRRVLAYLQPLPPPTSARGARRRRVGLAVLFVALGWIALATLQLLAIRNETGTGTRHASAARAALLEGDLTGGEVAEELERAAGSFANARRRAGGVVLAPLRVLPVVGRQVTSVASLSGAAADVARITAGTARATEAALRLGEGPDGDRVAMLRRLAEQAVEADRSLAGVDLSHSRALIDPLARRWAALEASVAEARDGLRTGAAVLNGVADLLAGPRRYLLLAANNAEMRAGSGMFLSAGSLAATDGSLALGPMRPAGDLILPGAGVPVDDDLGARWGWLGPGREWRNLGTTPRFDQTAPVAARMWEELTGEHVDGVLAVDVELLRAMLAATGPVAVGETTVSAATVLDFLLRDQYRGVDVEDPVQADRRDQLGLLATSVLEVLEAGRYVPGRLARELAVAGRGRHVLAWSSVPSDQATWEAAGVTGSLGATALAVNVLNRGGNKLDQFLQVDAALRAEPSRSDSQLTLEVTLRNDTPAGLPRYVVGPHPDSGVREGEYLGILTVNLPGAAIDATIEGAPPLSVAGPDGPTLVVTAGVLVPRGEQRTVVVRFRLPAPQREMVVAPSARIPPMRWTAGPTAWTDDRPHAVAWGLI